MQQRLSFNCLPITLVFRESCELFYQNEHKFWILNQEALDSVSASIL